MLRTLILSIVVLGAISICGCGAERSNNAISSSEPWWTLVITKAGDALGGAIEVIHDGSGWMLGKMHIEITKVGESRKAEDGSYVADFSIRVANSDETFTSEIKDVQCDELGVPTKVSQEKFDEAVTRIKEMLGRLQQ